MPLFFPLSKYINYRLYVSQNLFTRHIANWSKSWADWQIEELQKGRESSVRFASNMLCRAPSNAAGPQIYMDRLRIGFPWRAGKAAPSAALLLAQIRSSFGDASHTHPICPWSCDVSLAKDGLQGIALSSTCLRRIRARI